LYALGADHFPISEQPCSRSLNPSFISDVRVCETFGAYEVEARRVCHKQRAASIPLDTRTVLYGESLLAFIIENADQDPEADAIVDIHRQWLMTPREDLSGHSFFCPTIWGDPKACVRAEQSW
jgi:hypothetical protein